MDLFDGEIQGLERLRAYGELLYGDVSELGVHLGPYEVGDRLNHKVHRGMYAESEQDVERIYLHFPGLDRDDLSLRSEEGILFVGVNGREHEIPTQSPVKSSNVKAKLENDILLLEVPIGE